MTFQASEKETVDFAVPPVHSSPRTFSQYHSKMPLGDRVLALIALVTLLPFLLVLGLLIVIGGQSPIFVQERIGQYCKPFRIFKFRTMPNEGWDEAKRAAALSYFARFQLFVFRNVSKVLRATGLDELPQFVNILKGDMQIIGPRPLVAADFNALPDGREVRCVVRPGITGLAQINGGQELDPDSKLALDLYVIDHLSFRITVKVITRSVLRVLGFTSATASISSDDLKRAREHMANRMRPATVPTPQSVAVTGHPQPEWLSAPVGGMSLPIRFISPRASMGSPAEVAGQAEKLSSARW